ncbi:MAG: tonB-system energizer ExbB [Rhodospirillaceae bacterium]|nr:tonB-system energizer ExbB [Rhodospirillaceae bacterium]
MKQMGWLGWTFGGTSLFGSMPAWAQDQMAQSLSPWQMFVTANPVVQAVMVGLFLASVVTWTVWLAKIVEIIVWRRRVGASLRHLSVAGSLESVCAQTPRIDRWVLAMAHSAKTAVRQNRGGTHWSTEAQIAARLDRHRIAAGRALDRGTGVLATIGAIAPFVGLFGTVWGIMNSFVGIAQSQTANLAVVAPGIAEALLATGTGLAAAIPAVIAYNLLRRFSASVKVQLGDAAVEIRRLAAWDAESQVNRFPAKAAE